MSGFPLAVCAGLFAALASVSSKLALEQDGRTIRLFLPCSYVSTLTCSYIVILLRAMCIVLMLLFNALMWTTFVKSLQKCSSTIQATVTNSAANFFFSAVFGMLLFGESLALLWWLGASLIILGLLLLNYTSQQTEQSELATESDKKQQ